MKSTFTLLILVSSFATSSPIPSHMLEKNPSKLNLIFSYTKVLHREARLSRKSRDARKCRFCLRKIPKTREIRVARLTRKPVFNELTKEDGKKLAILQ